MNNMNTTGPTNTNGTAMCTAQPASTRAKPTYIGLRVYRYMPPVTTVDAASIFTGLMVVLARRNANTPSTKTITPEPAKPHDIARRKGLSPTGKGDERATAHIAVPISKTTMGGGILFSNVFIMRRRPRFLAGSRIFTY